MRRADRLFQGVLIEGEAGVGHRLGAGFDLPLLMFSAVEPLALVRYAPPAEATEAMRLYLITLAMPPHPA